MITRENIIHFYTKYKENLKTEDQIQENLLKAEDQEAWIENLKNKSRMMRRLYIENEALLNLYIRPFLDGEAELNEELAAQNREDLSFVWDAVKQLPVPYREVIHLFYQEGYPTVQIAEILKRKESTVRSDLRRGRAKLKQVLKEAYDFDGTV